MLLPLLMQLEMYGAVPYVWGVGGHRARLSKPQKKLVARIERLEEKIAEKMEAVEQPSIDVSAIYAEIKKLQAKLAELRALLEESYREQAKREDEDVMAIYIAYRRLH